MFDGEKASLEAILSTNMIRVPKPVKVVDLESGGAVFIMEHIDMKSLNRFVSVTANTIKRITEERNVFISTNNPGCL